MKISRSGYYRWLRHKDIENDYKLNRDDLCRLIVEIHNKHKSWGYRKINSRIRDKIGWVVSDVLVHKCCKFLDIKSVVRSYKYKKPGEEHIIYPNIIKNDWKSSKPLEKVCTDMTCIKYRSNLYDTTLYLDAFNNEILSCGYTSNHNSISSYYDGLFPYLEQTKRIDYPSTLHSDQGVVYSSMAFTNAHKDYNIIRSMSRAGTPTDNPKIESINGWIKDEIENDFDIDSYESFDDFIKEYIYYFNHERPAYALKYKTPIQYKTDLGF
jgi:transposase InsO family protein